VITRAGVIGRWLAVAAAAAALGGSPPAAARPDWPPADAEPAIRTVVVPVPVHDWVSDVVHMGVAAGLGAALAARTAAARVRRRETGSPSASGLIDITDAVQTRASP
jgi:hypothetical protein